MATSGNVRIVPVEKTIESRNYFLEGSMRSAYLGGAISKKEYDKMFKQHRKAFHNRLAESRIVFPGIENVIFNHPATIVYWDDGTRTVVKVQGSDAFDPEKGLAMAIAKKAFGNKGAYFNEIKKYTEEPSDD